MVSDWEAAGDKNECTILRRLTDAMGFGHRKDHEKISIVSISST